MADLPHPQQVLHHSILHLLLPPFRMMQSKANLKQTSEMIPQLKRKRRTTLEAQFAHGLVPKSDCITGSVAR